MTRDCPSSNSVRQTLRRVIASAMIGGACLFAVMLPGCGGCSCDREETTVEKREREKKELKKQQAEKKKEEEEKKRDFEVVAKLRVQPSDTPQEPKKDDDDQPEPVSYRAVKPGHWLSTALRVRTNNFDFHGELASQSVGSDRRLIGLERTPFEMRISRPASLAKGHVKQVESTFFIPRSPVEQQERIWLDCQLQVRGGGGNVLPLEPEPATRMPPYQYFFIVLSDTPDRYRALNNLVSVKPPALNLDSGDYLLYYRFAFIDTQKPPLTLPSNSLTWTNTAYVLWDNADPNALSIDQQTALVDWLHWGGQLIISGPDSLTALRASFLRDHLPAEATDPIELTQNDFNELNSTWSLVERNQGRTRRKLTIDADKRLAGVRLQPRESASVVKDTGGLVVERRVGRGRVVLTAFPLADRAVLGWANFDGFFNGCLLRRPARNFGDWRATWRDYPLLHKDPLLVTTLRYFSRDLGHLTDKETELEESLIDDQRQRYREQRDPYYEDEWAYAKGAPGGPGWESEYDRRRDENALRSEYDRQNTERDDWHFGGYYHWRHSGVGAWNDVSGVSSAARDTLREAAGIDPPDRNKVLMILAVYLAILVPVNWLVFKLIGRIEWAWLTMPLIAIVGAFVVVWQAQLDIGFVRSRTEIAVLEVHGDYDRAHLTRYTALYASLSTSYDVVFDDDSSLALPFATDPSFSGMGGESIDAVEFRREDKVSLRDFQVNSNSTGVVHCEQMFELGGAFRLLGGEDDFRIKNDTALALKDAGVLYRTPTGRIAVAWIGDLDAHSSERRLAFRFPPDEQPRLNEWDESPAMLSLDQEARMLLRRYDTNGNQHLEKKELDERPDLLEHFDKIDRRVSKEDDAEESRPDGRLDHRELAQCCGQARKDKVCLGRFVDLATQRLKLANGEMRLIGWSDRPLPGVAVYPDVSQAVARTFVLVHLQPGLLPPATRDANHYADFNQSVEDFDPTREFNLEELLPRND